MPGEEKTIHHDDMSLEALADRARVYAMLLYALTDAAGGKLVVQQALLPAMQFGIKTIATPDRCIEITITREEPSS